MTKRFDETKARLEELISDTLELLLVDIERVLGNHIKDSLTKQKLLKDISRLFEDYEYDLHEDIINEFRKVVRSG